MEILGILIASTGLLIALLNWPLFIFREMRKSGPSAVPVVGVVLFISGSVMSSSEVLNRYIWLILLIDFTAVPMLFYLTFKAIIGGKSEEDKV